MLSFPLPTLEMLTGFQRHRLALLALVILIALQAKGSNGQPEPRGRCPIGWRQAGWGAPLFPPATSSCIIVFSVSDRTHCLDLLKSC